ncbi:hypothetical protein QT327_07975 [Olivibacter sp. 47]|uniref:hypothetical protein n=1 Tax=Olivibacter sp. 47 TaxID=3056486 RepID=UPI0025A48B5E|nr:hypothetical protein [Olivibacter sp. 47]MDM8174295.1 hypothetical protein [Olivibacter sp. 47]
MIYKKRHYLSILTCCLIGILSCNQKQTKKNDSIDRKAVVTRHNVVNESIDSLSSLTVGNGEFAFTVDVTGLQTFPLLYEKGVALGTQSEWAWDSFKNEKNFRFEETLKSYDFNNEGRDAKYSVQWKEPQRNKEATDWFRENAHRLQLGNIGFELYKKMVNAQKQKI